MSYCLYTRSKRSGLLALWLISCVLLPQSVLSQDVLPIADAHVHYSHDSVEMTPPERVVELMRNAQLKFAMVSSSDDNGTQLLRDLAPELIVPSLRPYRRRGESGSWFKDPAALDYVERLLAENRYVSIGEFHLFGESADLPIPRRIVELAEEHNLLLHAHSDAEAVERLLAQSDTVKVIWAHSGFDEPADIAAMLSKHDRLWADLAFRFEVGRGGQLSADWKNLFEAYPDRFMLGTDTYTPERIFFIPEHATSARLWLNTLPKDLAENIAWKNAFNLIMPMWKQNRISDNETSSNTANAVCTAAQNSNTVFMENDQYRVVLEQLTPITVSKPIEMLVTVCGDVSGVDDFMLDASMPKHGHGTNYLPNVVEVEKTNNHAVYRVEGVVLHMPGVWQWDMSVVSSVGKQVLNHDFVVE